MVNNDTQKVAKVLQNELVEIKNFMESYLTVQLDVYKILENSNKFLSACVSFADKVNVLRKSRADVNEIAECIKSLILFISKNLQVFSRGLSKAVIDTNKLLKSLKDQLPSMYQVELTCELDPNTSISSCFLEIADTFEDILDLLAGFKTVLLNDCHKTNLAEAINQLCIDIKNNIVPVYKQMGEDVEATISSYHNDNDNLIYLRDPKIKLSGKIIKNVNVLNDDFSY